MSERFDLYGPIHKALRYASAQLLVRLGNADWRDPVAAATTLAALRAYLVIAREHLLHEDAEIHPLLHGFEAALGETLDEDHGDHHLGFVELEGLAEAVEAATDDARPQAGHALYLRFARHFGEDLQHMDREETVAQAVLRAHLDDAGLQAIESRIVGSIPPERMLHLHRMMLPAMAPAERAGMLRQIGAAAPPEFFAMLRDEVARDCLAPQDYRMLLCDLSLPV